MLSFIKTHFLTNYMLLTYIQKFAHLFFVIVDLTLCLQNIVLLHVTCLAAPKHKSDLNECDVNQELHLHKAAITCCHTHLHTWEKVAGQ